MTGKNRISRIVVLVPVVLSVICSCTKEIYTDIQEQAFSVSAVDGAPAFYAKIGTETKTFIDSNFGSIVCWHGNDRFSVLAGETNIEYEFKGKDGDTEGYIIKTKKENIEGLGEQDLGTLGTVTKAGTVLPDQAYLVYPFDKAITLSKETGEISMVLPGSQTYSKGSFAQNANPMVAVADLSHASGISTVDVAFNNIGAIMRLPLYGSDVVKSIKLRGNAGEKLSGAAVLTVSDEGVPSIVMADDASEELLLDCGEGVRLSDNEVRPTYFYLVIPPVTFSTGFTIEVTNEYGDVLSKSTTKGLSFNRSCITSMSAIELKMGETGCFETFALSDGSNVYPAFSMMEGAVHVMVPREVDLSSMKAIFTYFGRTVTSNGVSQVSDDTRNDYSDFTKPVIYDITASDGSLHKWQVNIYDLPVLVINTPDGSPITSKDVRTEGCTVMLRKIDNSEEDLGTAGIKGRGNSTWDKPKKPYNVKLDKKKSILGLENGNKSKHWTLLACYYFDKSLLHNPVAFEMAKLTDYPWVQDGTFVELIFNDVYQGIYHLTSKPRVEKNKIDIDEDNGFLLETNMGDGAGALSFKTDFFNTTGDKHQYHLSWSIENPDPITPEQKTFIVDKMNAMEELIYEPDSLATGKYRDYFDIETAINWWLVEEVAQNPEAGRSKNIMMYVDKDSDKFYMAPPWDFDYYTFRVMKNHFHTKDCALYYSALFNDPVFVSRVKEKWAAYKPVWETKIIEFIDAQYSMIARSAKRNEAMWPDWDVYWRDETYDESVEEVKRAFLGRMEWLNGQISSMQVNNQ